MQTSLRTEDPVNQTDNWQYEIEFKAEYDAYRTRLQKYENNTTKACVLTCERCAKGMKRKNEPRFDFDGKIENRPIVLLKAIREHAKTVLSNQRVDTTRNESNRFDKKKEEDSEEEDQEEQVSLTFAQMAGKCHCWGKSGHKFPFPIQAWERVCYQKAQQSHDSCHWSYQAIPPLHSATGACQIKSSKTLNRYHWKVGLLHTFNSIKHHQCKIALYFTIGPQQPIYANPSTSQILILWMIHGDCTHMGVFWTWRKSKSQNGV